MDEKGMTDQIVFVDDFGTGHVTTWFTDGTSETHFTTDYDEIYSIDPDEASKLDYLWRDDPY